MLDAIGFDRRIREAALVVTGEGALDRQTLQGKILGELATRCRQAGVACHAVDARILDLESVTEATSLEALEVAGRALADAL